MNLETTSTYNQTSHATPSPQRDTMSWRMSLLTVILGSMMVFLLLTVRSGRASHLNSHDHILDVVESIALSMGFIGSGELRKGGHRRASRIAVTFVITSIVVFLIVICIFRFWMRTDPFVATKYLLYPYLAIYATFFPLSLYLNRKQSEPSLQPTTDNAP